MRCQRGRAHFERVIRVEVVAASRCGGVRVGVGRGGKRVLGGEVRGRVIVPMAMAVAVRMLVGLRD